ncbi:pyridoxal-phosphate dependent enzyme [Rhizobium ruizarguesonis]|uniref:pyridoxal-phosphate dependent enzyme n=1 Tax=Rhizobium ruizarguesonis TaxID=2081791 RepID=UPI0013EE7002|nr:pyridoxal-phosphate dependent enzyme [Rhizobium ruizarguesonis]
MYIPPMSNVYLNGMDAIESPRLVQLEDNIIAVVFSLMKLLPARFIIENALQRGEIREGDTVVETSSGTFALGLAIVCNHHRLRLRIVTGESRIDPTLMWRLRDLGAEVEVLSEPDPGGGLMQKARLNRVHAILRENPSFFWPCQYDNPDNRRAYTRLAELIQRSIGSVDQIVGTVGSGGSMCGTVDALRKSNSKLLATGVDTLGSVLFGLKRQPKSMGGLGGAILPKNVVHSTFDLIYWISGRAAFLGARALHSKHAIFAGGTSGAAYLVAKDVARANPGQRIAAIFPDDGYRYVKTIYNDEWLFGEARLRRETAPTNAKLVNGPSGVRHDLQYMRWGRRTLTEVGSLEPSLEL